MASWRHRNIGFYRWFLPIFALLNFIDNLHGLRFSFLLPRQFFVDIHSKMILFKLLLLKSLTSIMHATKYNFWQYCRIGKPFFDWIEKILIVGLVTKFFRAIFSKCRKTKTKVIILANRKGRRSIHCPIKTRSNYKKRGKTCASKPRLVLVLLLIGWTRKWRESFKPITERSNAKLK